MKYLRATPFLVAWILMIAFSSVIVSVPTASAAPGDRYEFVLQDGSWWYVLDNEQNSRAWAGHCVSQLGSYEDVVWNDISGMSQETTPGCSELVRRIESNADNSSNASSGDRYEFVLQDGSWWYVLDYEQNSRAWAGHCVGELGSHVDVVWDDISGMSQETTPDCPTLVSRIGSNATINNNSTTNNSTTNNNTTVTSGTAEPYNNGLFESDCDSTDGNGAAPSTYTFQSRQYYTVASDDVWRITEGTDCRSSIEPTNTPILTGNERDNSGMRTRCPVSHFSYDDSILRTNQPGAAHLHMFWGNTGANAFTDTAAELEAVGRSTCEGGRANTSAYWAPAVVTSSGQVVLPSSISVYYKSLPFRQYLDVETIQPIPNGLQMVMNKDVEGADSQSDNLNTSLSIDDAADAGQKSLYFQAQRYNNNTEWQLLFYFPQCVQLDGSGNPILSSSNGTDHLAYATWQRTGPNNEGGYACDDGYIRIPQLSYNLTFNAAQLGSDFTLVSGGMNHMYHADYIASWDETEMQTLVDCNKAFRSECEFDALFYDDPPNGARTNLPGNEVATQHDERLFAAGTTYRLYSYSNGFNNQGVNPRLLTTSGNNPSRMSN